MLTDDQIAVLKHCRKNSRRLFDVGWDYGRERAEACIAGLLSEKLIAIYHSCFTDEPEIELKEEELTTLLANITDDTYWTCPENPDGQFYSFIATKAGRRRLSTDPAVREFEEREENHFWQREHQRVRSRDTKGAKDRITKVIAELEAHKQQPPDVDERRSDFEDYLNTSMLISQGKEEFDLGQVTHDALVLREGTGEVLEEEDRVYAMGVAFGMYEKNGHIDPFVDHIAWFIINNPWHPAAIAPLTLRVTSHPEYPILAHLWLNLVRRHPDDIVLLDHAATFFSWRAPRLSRLLWQRCESIEPENPQWPIQQFRMDRPHTFDFLETSKTPDTHLPRLRSALGAGMRAFDLRKVNPLHDARTESLGRMDVRDLAFLALQCREFDQALKVARYFLQFDTQYEKDVFHSIEGISHLLQGRHEDALRSLDKLTQGPHPTELGFSMGPELSLAQALVHQGYSEDVIQYLGRCKAHIVENIKLFGAEPPQYHRLCENLILNVPESSIHKGIKFTKLVSRGNRIIRELTDLMEQIVDDELRFEHTVLH